ncbi:MAG: hypothetical protein FWH48_09125, partial [Oscillospiraceae bacterium]|nr:hypothetical protein [Oscillospiraceae bacterium]
MDKMDKFDINDTNQMPIKPKVKTIYLDASGNMGRGAAFLGTAFLFLCIFAVCLGLAFCVIDSFKLDVSLGLVAGTLFFTVLFCTLIYFLPSRIFTLLAFLLGAGGLTLYAATNYDILQAAYYTLNLCLYRIQEEGYRIGGIVDNQLAERSD